MPNYLNPESLITSTGWKPEGPLAGAIEGMRTNIGLESLDRMNRDTDLAYAGKLLEQQNAQKEESLFGDDLRRAKAEETRAKLDEYLSGRARQKSELTNEGLSLGNKKTKLALGEEEKKQKLEQFANAGELTEAFVMSNADLIKKGQNPFLSNPIGTKVLNEQFASQGIPPLSSDPHEAWQQVTGMYKMYSNNKERLKELRLFQQQKDLHRIDATSREAVAETRASRSEKHLNLEQAMVKKIQENPNLTSDEKFELMGIMYKTKVAMNSPGSKLESLDNPFIEVEKRYNQIMAAKGKDGNGKAEETPEKDSTSKEEPPKSKYKDKQRVKYDGKWGTFKKNSETGVLEFHQD